MSRNGYELIGKESSSPWATLLGKQQQQQQNLCGSQAGRVSPTHSFKALQTSLYRIKELPFTLMRPFPHLFTGSQIKITILFWAEALKETKTFGVNHPPWQEGSPVWNFSCIMLMANCSFIASSSMMSLKFCFQQKSFSVCSIGLLILSLTLQDMVDLNLPFVLCFGNTQIGSLHDAQK